MTEDECRKLIEDTQKAQAETLALLRAVVESLQSLRVAVQATIKETQKTQLSKERKGLLTKLHINTVKLFKGDAKEAKKFLHDVLTCESTSALSDEQVKRGIEMVSKCLNGQMRPEVNAATGLYMLMGAVPPPAKPSAEGAMF